MASPFSIPDINAATFSRAVRFVPNFSHNHLTYYVIIERLSRDRTFDRIPPILLHLKSSASSFRFELTNSNPPFDLRMLSKYLMKCLAGERTERHDVEPRESLHLSSPLAPAPFLHPLLENLDPPHWIQLLKNYLVEILTLINASTYVFGHLLVLITVVAAIAATL